MERFWVYIGNQVQGPMEIPALRKLSGFNLLTQVCREGQESWRMADEVIEIKAYFSAPPRVSSLATDGQSEFPVERPQIEMSLPGSAAVAVEMSRPMPAGRPELNLVETLPDTPADTGLPPLQNDGSRAAPADGLRQSCATCGYKNPRDVGVCMKCGAPLKTAAAPAAVEQKPPAVTVPSIAVAPSIGATAPESMVDIPVKRIALILLSVVFIGVLFFTARHFWKARHRHPSKKRTVVVTTTPKPLPSHTTSSKSKSSQKASAASKAAAALPGVSAAAPVGRPIESRKPAKEDVAARTESEAAPSETASYKVISRAYPLQQRQPAPVDSTYATKRRGDQSLWVRKEEEAIQRVQNHRLYGGLRTIRRNTEILMQILRDREYATAFETGKRIYLLNDVDWAATPRESPRYEVQLTFSGGKEADGSPRAPLRFAFNVDLERQTVEPGGGGTIKANTMHAFFDESRIPPEERRSVVKDTENLINAAQPSASPLALDAAAKQYAATYSYPALTRIGEAYGLTLVNKKLAYVTSSVNDSFPPNKTAAKSETAAAPKTPVKTVPSASGAIEYTIERLNGKERQITAKAPSKASPAKLWETTTSYDQLTQFVPNMLVSRREGQDGRAVIVHTVSLTKLMFFVFKISLHLRILEHPQQRRLEFERIAGDFEKFSGYAEMVADPTGTRSSLNLNVTLAPKGYVPNWVLKNMAQDYVVPVLEAIRAKAESY